LLAPRFAAIETVDQRYGTQFQYYEPAKGLFDDLLSNQKAFRTKANELGQKSFSEI
jgi:hypothetical protein